ncbi:MAG: helix-turn-helix transcriptional regulator [Clostridia bacterium]|nr:helix-turn-helix transcriptional regulator [Clostridia bacterium]
MNKQAFGERLRTLRMDKGFSLQQLAGRIGVSKSMVSFYESGERLPSYDVLFEICRVLDTSVEYMLYGGDNHRLIDVTGLAEDEIEVLSTMAHMLRRNKG